MKKTVINIVIILNLIFISSVFCASADDVFKAGFRSYIKGDYADAVINFSKAIGINPNREQYYYFLGKTFEKLGKISKAEESYIQSLKINKDYIVGRLQLSQLYFQQQAWENSAKNLEKILALTPKNFNAQLMLGICYYYLTEYDKSLEHLNFAIQLTKEDARPYFYIGKIHMDQGQWLDAASKFTKAVELNSKVGEYYFWRGSAFYAQSDFLTEKDNYWQSAADFRKAIELGYTTAQCYFLFGNTLLNRGLFLIKNTRKDDGIELVRAAIEQYKKVISLEPSASNAYHNMAWGYFALNKLSEALTSVKRAIDIEPLTALFYDTLGDIYFKLGQFEKAIDSWETVLELEPDYTKQGIVILGDERKIEEKIRDASQRK